MKKALILLILASILGNFAGGILQPVQALFVQQIGGDILSIGWSSTLYFLAIGLFIFIFGKLSDRIGKTHLLLAGFIVILFVDIYFIFIKNVLMLFIGEILLGIGIAMTNPSWNGLFSALVDKGKEASQWGTWEFGVSIGTAIAALVGAYIVALSGFIALFIIKAILHFGSVLLVLNLKGESNGV